MRPTRPSETRSREAAAAAAKLTTEKDTRLVIELHPGTRKNLKVRAAQEGLTVKAYLLRLAARDGVVISEQTD